MILGTCSICGGRVSVPDAWLSVIPPRATCEDCGAVRADHGPVIDMVPAKPYRSTTTTHVQVDGKYAQSGAEYIDYLQRRPSKK